MTKERTRFAPSPTGFMHLGNARSALLSYLCAFQSGGDFILRIEDTDFERNNEKFYDSIFFYCTWLKIKINEGPQQGGDYGPYYQSQRTDIYKEYLDILYNKKLIYRCFKTFEECEKERSLQIAKGLPPRYIRPEYSEDYIYQEEEFNKKTPFVWRFKLSKEIVSIYDKVRGTVTYDLSQFADFPLTRQDGTFTFIFANFVDDVTMKISYVLRGEEHFSNSALQAALYKAFSLHPPKFYHLPLLCDSKGKKLSKRDFGFSLQDLINEGFLPEAVINYLIIIGGSFAEEIFSLNDAIKDKYFDKINGSGTIHYDQKKLEWLNTQWMKKIETSDFINYINFYYTFDQNIVNNSKHISHALKNLSLVESVKKESLNIKYFNEYLFTFCPHFIPSYTECNFINKDIINEIYSIINNYSSLADIKNILKEKKYLLKEIIQTLRYIISGKNEGLSFLCYENFLSYDIFKNRFDLFLKNNKF